MGGILILLQLRGDCLDYQSEDPRGDETGAEENASLSLVQITEMKECDDGKTSELDCVVYSAKRTRGSCQSQLVGFYYVW